MLFIRHTTGLKNKLLHYLSHFIKLIIHLIIRIIQKIKNQILNRVIHADAIHAIEKSNQTITLSMEICDYKIS